MVFMRSFRRYFGFFLPCKIASCAIPILLIIRPNTLVLIIICSSLRSFFISIFNCSKTCAKKVLLFLKIHHRWENSFCHSCCLVSQCTKSRIHCRHHLPDIVPLREQIKVKVVIREDGCFFSFEYCLYLFWVIVLIFWIPFRDL